jgi:hypothetical protein
MLVVKNKEPPMETKIAMSLMNLLTNFDATVRAMATVEASELVCDEYVGDDLKFFLIQNEEDIESFVRENEKDEPYRARRMQKLAAKYNRHDDTCDVGCIYGRGGWNRWYVYPSGRVCFSTRLCIAGEQMIVAQMLGFELL